MAFKIVILSALLAIANAGFLNTQYHAAPAAVAYQSAPASYAYHAAPAAVAYHAAPAPVAYHAAPAAVAYHAAPAPVAYHAAPAPLAYASAPLAVHKTINAEDDPHPQYSYSYDVQDASTGDFKNQEETRDGDVVRGSYSLLEADGTRRVVSYTADSINGFNAVVNREPAHVAAPVVAKAVLPAYAYHH